MPHYQGFFEWKQSFTAKPDLEIITSKNIEVVNSYQTDQTFKYMFRANFELDTAEVEWEKLKSILNEVFNASTQELLPDITDSCFLTRIHIQEDKSAE